MASPLHTPPSPGTPASMMPSTGPRGRLYEIGLDSDELEKRRRRGSAHEVQNRPPSKYAAKRQSGAVSSQCRVLTAHAMNRCEPTSSMPPACPQWSQN